eukprot:2696354-Alexandrium_andersonii.AAC.1
MFVDATLRASWLRGPEDRASRSLRILLTTWPAARKPRLRCTSASTALACLPSTRTGAAPG